MPIRHLLLSFLVTVMASAVTTNAWADPSSSSTLRESLGDDAGAKFDDGSRLYKISQFAEAREAFLAAYAKSGDPRVLYNVAVCDKSLGRYARAIAILRKSLAGTDRALPAAYTQKVSETIATLSRYVAFVTVQSTVEGTTITVDGEPLRENPTPLETGNHTIGYGKDGYESGSTPITVKAGESQTISVTPQRSQTPGAAHISCVGVGARPCEIRIGGESLGAAPVTFTRDEGSYVVKAFVDGRAWAEQRVELHNGSTVEIGLVGRVVQNGRIRVTTDRYDDVVAVDGKSTGRSGIEVELPPGEHRLVISRADGASKSIDVLLGENETRDLRVTLDEKRSGVSPWWFVGGGVVLAGVATAAIVIISNNRPTRFEGSSAGSLNPYVVPASLPGGFR